MGKHLTYQQRIELEFMHKQGYSRSKMAAELGVSIRTVFYELKRGYYERLDGETWKMLPSYSADIAQQDYEENQGFKARPVKLGKSWAFVEYLEEKIGRQKYSPRAVLAEISSSGLDFGFTVSHSTLYAWIDRGYLTVTYKNLPEGKRHKKKSSERKGKVNYSHPGKTIEHRPAADGLGHWEMDTVIGKRDGKQKCLLVLTERSTGFEIVKLMRDKTAAETVRLIDELEREYGGSFRDLFKSITVDNGKEFSDWQDIEKDERTKLYYCHPYSSWERGKNERANRLIRRFCPKGQSMNKVTKKQVKYIQTWMNNYPRRSLGWQTPKQMLLLSCEAFQITLPCTV